MDGYILVCFRPSDCYAKFDEIIPLASPISVQRLPKLETAIIVAYTKASSDRLVTFVGHADTMEEVNGRLTFTAKFWEHVYNFRPKTLYSSSREVQDDVDMLIDEAVSKILEEYLGVKVST